MARMTRDAWLNTPFAHHLASFQALDPAGQKNWHNTLKVTITRAKGKGDQQLADHLTNLQKYIRTGGSAAIHPELQAARTQGPLPYVAVEYRDPNSRELVRRSVGKDIVDEYVHGAPAADVRVINLEDAPGTGRSNVGEGAPIGFRRVARVTSLTRPIQSGASRRRVGVGTLPEKAKKERRERGQAVDTDVLVEGASREAPFIARGGRFARGGKTGAQVRSERRLAAAQAVPEAPLPEHAETLAASVRSGRKTPAQAMKVSRLLSDISPEYRTGLKSALRQRTRRASRIAVSQTGLARTRARQARLAKTRWAVTDQPRTGLPTGQVATVPASSIPTTISAEHQGDVWIQTSRNPRQQALGRFHGFLTAVSSGNASHFYGSTEEPTLDASRLPDLEAEPEGNESTLEAVARVTHARLDAATDQGVEAAQQSEHMKGMLHDLTAAAAGEIPQHPNGAPNHIEAVALREGLDVTTPETLQNSLTHARRAARGAAPIDPRILGPELAQAQLERHQRISVAHPASAFPQVIFNDRTNMVTEVRDPRSEFARAHKDLVEAGMDTVKAMEAAKIVADVDDEDLRKGVIIRGMQGASAEEMAGAVQGGTAQVAGASRPEHEAFRTALYGTIQGRINQYRQSGVAGRLIGSDTESALAAAQAATQVRNHHAGEE